MGDECSMCVSAVNCRTVAIPAFLAASLWQHVVDTLKLSPQQARMVGLMLQGMQDKQIAAEMKLSLCTIRTYMRRLFDRLGVDSRGGVILRVFALCASSGPGVGVRPLYDILMDDIQNDGLQRGSPPAHDAVGVADAVRESSQSG